MKKQFNKLFTIISLLIIIVFILFIINQTHQIVELAKNTSQLLGDIVLYGLLTLYSLIICIPIYLFFVLPSAIKPPPDINSLEYKKFKSVLLKRLKNNSYLKKAEINFSEINSIQKSIDYLDKKADDLIKKTAATIFVSTAISQSGRLDALLVLIAQSKLIYGVAKIYNQRPSPAELIRLYANIATTAFFVSEIEDLDISEQVEPIVTSVMGGSLASIVPGVNVLASFVTNSVLEGTANAYLTLRVGIIARRYCGLLAKEDKRSIRRFASAVAAKMLGSIVIYGAKKVSNLVWESAKNRTSKFSIKNIFSKEIKKIDEGSEKEMVP